MMRVYISTPIDGLSDEVKTHLKNYLAEKINDLPIVYLITYEWSCPLIDGDNGVVPTNPKHLGIIARNQRWIKDAALVIAINPAMSGGVTFELGYAHALGIPIKIINLDWLESSMHCPTIMTSGL